jgi:hypothetical protein
LFRKAQPLFLKSSVAQILKIKQARNNNRLIFPSYIFMGIKLNFLSKCLTFSKKIAIFMGEPLRRASRSSRRAIRGSLRSYLRRLWRLGTRLRRAATIPLASWRKKRLKNLEVWGEWCMFVS